MKSWSGPLTVVTVFILCTLASMNRIADASDPLDNEVYCQINEEMDRLLDIVRESRAHIDRSAFDLSEKISRLNYEADDIVEFVRRSIAFEQYPGSLRGPEGTLLSMAGNALDQSLLLGNLLRDAGYDARIARATLDDESAAALLRQMKHSSDVDDLEHVDERLAESMVRLVDEKITAAELLEQLKSSANPENDPDYQEVRETTRYLRDALLEAGLEPGRPSGPASLIPEARDYFWVQYKDLAGDGWLDVHPSFVDAPPAGIPEPLQFISGAVPEDLLHRIRIQFFVERSVGDKLESVPISGVWERPVANLVDTPLSFAVIPTNVSGDMIIEGGVDEALDDSAIFALVFNGSVMEGGKFFDLKANIVDPMAASGAASGVVATVGDRFGDAVGGLGGDVPALTAFWVQITLVDPDGSETSYRRTTLDRIGPAARAEGKSPTDLAPTSPEDALPLLRAHTVMIAAGRTPESLVFDRTFDWTMRAEPLFRQLREQVAYRADSELEAPEFDQIEDLPAYWPGHLSLFKIFDRADALLESHRIYRSRPGVVIHVQGPSGPDSALEMIDIVTNARRAVAIENDTPRLDPQAAMITGVWDTAKEGMLLQRGEVQADTESVFAEAMASGKKLLTLAPGTSVSGVSLPPDVEASVESDLSRGFAVVIPEGRDRTDEAAWWRVNPETGETVGQIKDGRGATATEYQVVLGAFATAVTTSVLLYGLDQCHQSYQRCNSLRRPMSECSNEYWCCNTWGMGGAIFGLFAFASAALKSITFDIVTTVGPSPCG